MSASARRAPDASGLKLSVSSCPSQDLARTNYVFVHPSDFSSLFPSATSSSRLTSSLLLLASSYIYVAQPHKTVQPGTVALNAVQRRELRMAVADPIPAAPFPPSKKHLPEAAVATLEVDTVAKSRGMLELDADELAARFAARLVGFVMSVDQSFVLDFYGTSLILRVATLVAAGAREDGDAAAVPRALITPGSEVFFSRSPKSEIRISGGAEGGAGGGPARARQIFRADFSFEKMGVGGLDKEFSDIFRRAFASRVFPQSVVKKLGISHVKGMLLYGPPGTGKTLIARQIGKMMNGKEPKVVNGPEILNKFVGQSEENIRKLFQDAEMEYRERGDESELHIIIFDEIDAICKQRGTSQSSAGVGDTVVNQLLSKIDGVDSLNNILVIGMTNRKDMIDEALLRPGRLEVHVEISLPDEQGRQQILRIHTAKMMKNNMISANVDLDNLAGRTKNYSGAELEGVCKSAAAFALNRHVDFRNLQKEIKPEDVVLQMTDFEQGLAEVRPAFGLVSDAIHRTLLGGFYMHGPRMRSLMSSGMKFLEEVERSSKNPLISVLVEGESGTGKTALAAKLALESGFPFVRLVSPEMFVGYSEPSKCAALAKIFDDAHKSTLSVLVLDDLERLIEYAPIGPRFSNTVLQTLLVLVKSVPPPGRRLLIMGTTSSLEVMSLLGLHGAFNAVLSTPVLDAEEIAAILGAGAPYLELATVDGAAGPELRPSKTTPVTFGDNQEREMVISELVARRMGIKKLLMVLEMFRVDDGSYKRMGVVELQEILKDIA